MKPLHIVLAVVVAVVWGVAFVVTKVGLETYTPAQLTVLRFLVASIAAFWLPRPPVSWLLLVLIGLTVFTGQFLLQFSGIVLGMPAGLTAVVSQTQALFTVVFAALVLGDNPRAQQVAGMVVASVGLILIGTTLGADATAIGFTLTLGSAVSWAVGNVLIKRLPRLDMLRLMVWASLVPPLPAFALSLAVDGPGTLTAAVTASSWSALAAPVYLGLFATVLAYAIWGNLLQQYPASLVAPFALLSPCVAAIASALAFGEKFSPLRLAGMAGILAGVAIVAIPMRPLRQFLFRRSR